MLVLIGALQGWSGGALAGPPARARGDLLRLRAGAIDPRGLAFAAGAARGARGEEVVLVQATGPPEELRERLERAGAAILAFVPDRAWIVRTPAGMGESLAGWKGVRWVGEYHVAYRIEPAVVHELLSGVPERGAARYSIEAMVAGDIGAIRRRVDELGGIVEMSAGRRMEATLTRAQLLGMFDVMDMWFNAPDFRGCLFLNTAAEFPNPHDPVHQAAAAHKRRMRDGWRDLARQAGATLVVINLTPTSLDSQADLVIRGKAGDVMSAVVMELHGARDGARRVLS